MCENLELLRMIHLIKNIFEITLLIAPILLIIMASVDLGKIVVGGENVDKKMVSSITKRMIVAVVIFFVPTAVSVLLNMISETGVQSLSCWEEATESNVARLEEARAIEEEARRQEEEARRKAEQEEARRQEILDHNSSHVYVVSADHNGDVNLDGRVNDDDLTLLESYLNANGSVTLTPSQMKATVINNLNLTQKQLIAADVNGDFIVNSIDKDILEEHLLGIDPQYVYLPVALIAGDANYDGVISSSDYVSLMLMAANNCKNCSVWQRNIANVYRVNNNDVIDRNDLETLQKHMERKKGYGVLPIYNEVAEEEENNEVVDNLTIPASNSYAPFVNGVQKNLSNGEKVNADECLSFDDNCYCPTVGRFTGFKFTMLNGTDRSFASVERYDNMVTASASCSDGSTFSATVNSKVKKNYDDAFKLLCKLTTTGIDGVKIDRSMIKFGGTLVTRLNSARTVCSNHSYGTAIDYNYQLSITVDGKTYNPYAGQGKTTKTEYNNFIAALGSEDDSRNVNYIMWKKAFEPSGFIWGGNWSDSSFDPMHFEVR